MATPRVFVSSTFYDLKYIRENLKYFIKTIGYEPVLSEDGDVFYNPKVHTHESCLTEVPSCQIFVLIIGGRYGGAYLHGDKSITNMEYETAISNQIPVFALAESAVLSEHHVYNENIKRKNKNIEEISFPSVDNIKIFQFIDEVRKNTINNAIVPFRDFTDIENYLKKQWAGMMFSFLNDSINNNKVSNTLEEISKVNQKIEILTTQILKSVGKDLELVTVRLYEEMISNESFRAITYFRDKTTERGRIKVAPTDFMTASNFKDLATNFEIALRIRKEGDTIISGTGTISPDYYKDVESAFIKLKGRFEEILKEYGLDSKSYLEKQKIK